jgi:hypothetical protein
MAEFAVKAGAAMETSPRIIPPRRWHWKRYHHYFVALWNWPELPLAGILDSFSGA